ncbi:MAG: universal stress protein [Bacteroidales bacterium]|nr:universal stress protein [Bacteroidales bacterium]
MKKLLMAMDFSPSSVNAYQHALALAEKFGSAITLVYNNTGEIPQSLKNIDGATFKERLENKLIELNKEHNKVKIPTSLLVTEGTIYKEIIRVSEEIEADMIVVGHHGSHGVRRFFIGDNANKIIALAKCPVLTVQLHRPIGRDLSKIVIAIDNTLETRQKMPITMDIAQRFGAEVHVIGIYSSSVSTMKMRVDSYVKQAVAGLNSKGIKNHVQFMSTSEISKSTLNYANSINANLIITMVETEFFAKDVFLGSQGQQLVNQSHIPVLSVHNKEIIKTRPGL